MSKVIIPSSGKKINMDNKVAKPILREAKIFFQISSRMAVLNINDIFLFHEFNLITGL